MIDADDSQFGQDALAAVAVLVVIAFEQFEDLSQRPLVLGQRQPDFWFERDLLEDFLHR